MHFNFCLDREMLGAKIGLWVVLIIHSGPVFGLTLRSLTCLVL